MIERVFIDTNLLIYYYSEDEPHKSSVVENVIKSTNIVISTQIINEFSYVMLRKYRKEPELIREIIKEWKKEFEIKYLTPSLSIEALAILERYKFSFWDSLVIASAIISKCKVLYTEDLQHNQLIENRLKILDPFKSI